MSVAERVPRLWRDHEGPEDQVRGPVISARGVITSLVSRLHLPRPIPHLCLAEVPEYCGGKRLRVRNADIPYPSPEPRLLHPDQQAEHQKLQLPAAPARARRATAEQRLPGTCCPEAGRVRRAEVGRPLGPDSAPCQAPTSAGPPSPPAPGE